MPEYCLRSALSAHPVPWATATTVTPFSAVGIDILGSHGCWRGPFAAHLGLFRTPLERSKDKSGWNDIYTGGYSYFTSKSQVKRRAAAGCAWCKLLRKMLGAEGSRSIDRRPDGRWKVVVGTQQLGLSYCTPAGVQGLWILINETRHFVGYVYTASGNPAAQSIVARNPILDVGSLRALGLAKDHLNECLNGHEQCSMLVYADAPLPTRLVDCTDSNNPRLVSTEGRRGIYLTLSYVWGEPQPHRTIMSNIATYTRGIGVLPKTIRDAVYVTHALGFQYLWTDSLCIIQDSDEDKRREIGRMHLIYRYAYLTIIAASAARVSEGFLQHRPPSLRDIPLPYICPPHPPTPGEHVADCSTVQQVGEVHAYPFFTQAEGGLEDYNQLQEPINVRGWCLQEYYMSPRALVFTSETLQYRCQTARHNVGNAYYNPVKAGEQRLPNLLFRLDAPSVERGSEAWREVHTRWYAIVEDYTQRIVTEPSDKLVACGAIAEAFQRVLRTDYLAGLWRDTLLADLLWARHPAGTHSDRPAGIRAPSWSWAAADWRIEALGRRWLEAPPVAEVVRYEISLRDPQLVFGHVVGAHLVLRAAVMRCDLNASDTDVSDASPPSARRARRWEACNVVGEDDAILIEGTRERRRRAVINLDGDVSVGLERAWLVPLMRMAGETGVIGLVVAEASSSRSRKVYRRIGRFMLTCSWDALQAEVPISMVEVELV